MSKKLGTLCLAATLWATSAVAQRPGAGNRGTPPDPQAMITRRVDFLATLLNLTDAQKAQATTIFTNAQTADQAIQANLKTNRQSLSNAVKTNDTATIDQLSVTAGTLSGQMTGIQFKAEAAFYATLTPDQQAKYDSTTRRGPMGPGMGGPGRFGGPPRQ